MMVQPSQENIRSLIEVTAADNATAYAFLKANNNDVEQAVDAFFTNPDPQRYDNAVKWDEDAWSGERQGGNDLKVTNPAFDPGETAGGLAPSRPPSRTQHASSQIEQAPPTYGTVDSSWGPKKSSEDFEGVDEAIQRSLQDQGSSNVKRDLVGREIVPDVDAPARVRRQGEPAFLKPSVSGDFLPALLVALHAIPSCRNQLLASEHSFDDYGYNDSWWTGEIIQSPALSYLHDTSGGDEGTPPSELPITVETQRLMAFLDESERAYGSAEALAHTAGIEGRQTVLFGGSSNLKRFLEAWDNLSPERPMFKLSVTNITEQAFTDLNLLHIRNGSSSSIPLPTSASTFSDVLDNTLWEQNMDGQYDFEHFLAALPDVLVVDMCSHQGQAIEIPATLNLGRYMLSSKEVVEDMRTKNAVHLEEVRQIDSILEKIKYIKGTKKQTGTDAIAMLQESIKYLTERQDTGESRAESVRNGEVVRNLEGALVTLQARVGKLNGQRETAQAAVQPISGLITGSDKPEAASNDEEPCSQYILRGVATSAYQNFEVYIPAPELVSISDLPSRWWKMSYDTRQTTPEVTKQLVNESHVLSVATKGLHPTLLVYANARRLLSTETIPLSEALEHFIGLDNAAFREELKAAAAIPIVLDAEAMQGVTTAPIDLRRRSSGSSTRVELSDNEEDVTMGEGQGGAHTPTSPRAGTPMDIGSDGVAPPETQEMQEVGGPGLMGTGRERERGG